MKPTISTDEEVASTPNGSCDVRSGVCCGVGYAVGECVGFGIGSGVGFIVGECVSCENVGFGVSALIACQMMSTTDVE